LENANVWFPRRTMPALLVSFMTVLRKKTSGGLRWVVQLRLGRLRQRGRETPYCKEQMQQKYLTRKRHCRVQWQ